MMPVTAPLTHSAMASNVAMRITSPQRGGVRDYIAPAGIVDMSFTPQQAGIGGSGSGSGSSSQQNSGISGADISNIIGTALTQGANVTNNIVNNLSQNDRNQVTQAAAQEIARLNVQAAQANAQGQQAQAQAMQAQIAQLQALQAQAGGGSSTTKYLMIGGAVLLVGGLGVMLLRRPRANPVVGRRGKRHYVKPGKRRSKRRKSHRRH